VFRCGAVRPRVFDGVYRRRSANGELAAFDARCLEPQLAALDCGAYLDAEQIERHAALVGAALDAAHAGDSERERRLLDLGCGTGGYGVLLGERAEADVVGIDSSGVAIYLARERHAALAPRVSFYTGTFARTGLPDAYAGACVSVDALYLERDRAAALAEIRRVLKPGAALIFTAFQPVAGTQDSVDADRRPWAPFLARAGFALATERDITGAWRAHMRAKHQARWDARDALRARLGERVEPELAVTAAMLGLGGEPAFIDRTERHELVAHARSAHGS
jgi:malonyl-CoA O-methyltransferase